MSHFFVSKVMKKVSHAWGLPQLPSERPKGWNTKTLLCELSNSFPNIRKKIPNAYHFITINFFISHLPHPFNAGISATVILLKIPRPEFLTFWSLRVTSVYFLLTMSPLSQTLTLNAQNLIVNSPLQLLHISL